MDIQNPHKVLKKTIIVTAIIFILGLLIFFLSDKTIGVAILVGGVIGAIFGIVLFFKSKKKDPQSAKKIFAWFYIAGGLLLLFLVLLVFIFERESFGNIYFELGLGLLFLIYGIYYYVKHKQA